MSVAVLGFLLIVTLVVLQLFVWRIAKGPGDDEINEFGRDLGGRRAVLHFFEHEGLMHVRASIELPEDMPRLELARRGKAPVLAKWVGALAEQPLADADLAARFVCRVPESPRAFEALGRMKGRLLRLGDSLCEVKLERRSLALVLGGAKRADIEALCEHLSGVADAVLGPGGVRVHGEDAQGARCGFCHADLASEEELAAVACEECSTVVHQLCWTEHGRCPVLGGKGHSPVAARLKKREVPVP